MFEAFYQNPIYMFIEMLDEIKEKIPPKKYIFLLKMTPHNVFSPRWSSHVVPANLIASYNLD
jgi:hypothetical protein